MEEELNKVKKQEKDQEAAMQQLQKDIDELERENSKLKQSASTDRNSETKQLWLRTLADIHYLANTNGGAAEYTTFTGSLETSHLIEQVRKDITMALRHLDV